MKAKTKLIFSIICLILLGISAAIFYLPEIAENLFMRKLADYGYSTENVEIASVDHDNMEIHDLQLATTEAMDEEFATFMSDINIEYSIGSVFTQKAEKISIQSIDFKLKPAASGSARPELNSILGLLGLALPAEVLEVEKINIQVVDPETGEYVTRYSGKIKVKQSADDVLKIDLELAQVQPETMRLHLIGEVKFSADKINLQLDSTSSIKIVQYQLGALLAKDTELKFLDSSVNVDLTDPQNPIYFPNINLSTDRLSFAPHADFIKPYLSISGKWYYVNNEFTGKAILTAEQVDLKKINLRLKNILFDSDTFKIQQQKLNSTGKFDFQVLEFLNDDLINTPSHVKGNYNLTEAEISLDGDVREWRNIFSGTVKLHENWVQGSGSYFIDLSTGVLAKREIYLMHVLPKLQPNLIVYNGKIDLISQASWQNHSWQQQPNAKLQATNLYGTREDYNFEKLNAVLEFVDLAPLISKDNQKITIQRIDGKFEINNIDLRVQVRPDQHNATEVFVEQGKMDFSGGQITIKNLVINPRKPDERYRIGFQDLNLKKLLNLINLPGLTGEGSIDGHITVQNQAYGLYLKEGEFNAQQPGGKIAYKPKEVNPAFAKGSKAEILLQLLRDFQFTTLSSTLEREAKESNLKIILNGRNPDFYYGVPLNFNIDIAAPLYTMFDAGFLGHAIREKIQLSIEKAKVSGGDSSN